MKKTISLILLISLFFISSAFASDNAQNYDTISLYLHGVLGVDGMTTSFSLPEKNGANREGVFLKVGVDGAGVNFQGVLNDGHDGGDGGNGKDNAHQQQDHIVGLGKEGFRLIQPDGETAGGAFCGCFHGTSFRKGKRLWTAC